MKHDALVTRVVRHSPVISTVFFTVDGGVFPFTAGQYISVYFAQTGLRSGKAYSLSSAPFDKELAITVKNIGEFSGLICALKPGDHFEISSPFGFFNSNDDAPIVAIASGVGISPIWSIIRDELHTSNDRDITLYHTAAHPDELVFRSDVETLLTTAPRAHAYYFVTREDTPGATRRRFTIATDVTPVALASSRFYICGSEQFVRSIWVQLMEAGVSERRIVTETFFEGGR